MQRARHVCFQEAVKGTMKHRTVMSDKIWDYWKKDWTLLNGQSIKKKIIRIRYKQKCLGWGIKSRDGQATRTTCIICVWPNGLGYVHVCWHIISKIVCSCLLKKDCQHIVALKTGLEMEVSEAQLKTTCTFNLGQI